MKIGGGDYSEEAIEEAMEMARIVGTLMSGRVPIPAKAIEYKKLDPETLAKLDQVPNIIVAEPAAAVTITPVEGPCTPTTHLWGKPEIGDGITEATCGRCNLKIRSEIQGPASEVMADLLWQIPH